MLLIRRPRRSYKFIKTVVILILILILIFRYDVYRECCNEISDLFSLLCPYTFTITDKHIIFDNASYSIHHYPEFICPQNFRNMADWVYGWPENVFDEQVQNSVNQINETVAYLPHGSILYIKTDFLSTFFSEIYPHFRNKFVLVTGQGDCQAPGKHLRYLEEDDSKIIHWFGQNADINASTSERFTHIPIGKNIHLAYAFKKQPIAVYITVGI